MWADGKFPSTWRNLLTRVSALEAGGGGGTGGGGGGDLTQAIANTLYAPITGSLVYLTKTIADGYYAAKSEVTTIQNWISSTHFLTKSETDGYYSPIGALTKSVADGYYTTQTWVNNQSFLSQSSASLLFAPISGSLTYLTKAAADGYYTTQTWVTDQGFLKPSSANLLYAPISGSLTYLTKTLADGYYTTQTWVNSQNFLTKAVADTLYATVAGAGYLTKDLADGYYTTQSWVGQQGYLSQSSASLLFAPLTGSLTYLTKTLADGYYTTQTWVTSQGYLTKTAADGYYASIAGAGGYLTKGTADTLYALKSDITNINNWQEAVVLDLDKMLLKTDAALQYATIATLANIIRMPTIPAILVPTYEIVVRPANITLDGGGSCTSLVDNTATTTWLPSNSAGNTTVDVNYPSAFTPYGLHFTGSTMLYNSTTTQINNKGTFFVVYTPTSTTTATTGMLLCLYKTFFSATQAITQNGSNVNQPWTMPRPPDVTPGTPLIIGYVINNEARIISGINNTGIYVANATNQVQQYSGLYPNALQIGPFPYNFTQSVPSVNHEVGSSMRIFGQRNATNYGTNPQTGVLHYVGCWPAVYMSPAQLWVTYKLLYQRYVERIITPNIGITEPLP